MPGLSHIQHFLLRYHALKPVKICLEQQQRQQMIHLSTWRRSTRLIEWRTQRAAWQQWKSDSHNGSYNSITFLVGTEWGIQRLLDARQDGATKHDFFVKFWKVLPFLQNILFFRRFTFFSWNFWKVLPFFAILYFPTIYFFSWNFEKSIAVFTKYFIFLTIYFYQEILNTGHNRPRQSRPFDNTLVEHNVWIITIHTDRHCNVHRIDMLGIAWRPRYDN